MVRISHSHWLYLIIISSCLVTLSSSASLPVKAVNLGGWLVTEGWITQPSLFNNIPNKDMLDGTQLHLKSVTLNKYLSAEGGGDSIIAANHTSASDWETFKLWRVNETTFYLRVSMGQFVRISTRSSRLVAKATNPSTTEAFVIVRNSNNRVRIRAPNGLFVQAKTTADAVTADYTEENTNWGDNDPSVFQMELGRQFQGEFQLTNGYGSNATSVLRARGRLDLQNLFTHARDPDITLAEAKETTTIQELFTYRLTDMACEEIEILQQKLAQVTLNQLEEDGIQWQWADTGMYTVKSAYQRLKDGPRIQTSIHRIWKLQVPPRMKVFGWLLIRNKLLTVDNLKKKGFQLVNRSTLCKANQETARHMFNYCPFSRALYEEMARTILEKMAMVNASSSKTKVLTKTRVAVGQRSALLITFFILWRERCNRTFTERNKDIEELKSEVLWQMQFFEARSHRTTTP